jgi:hypothetical protein
MSCSRDDPYKAQVRNFPRRFEVKGKGYLLSETEPGQIDDDAIVYLSDGGARTFDFETKTVLRHLFVGTRVDFASLPTDERTEIGSIVNGALDFIRNVEKRHHGLSAIDQRDRELLTAFLANSTATR